MSDQRPRHRPRRRAAVTAVLAALLVAAAPLAGAAPRPPAGSTRPAPSALSALSAPSAPSALSTLDDTALRREIARVMSDSSVTTSTAKVGLLVADARTGRDVYVSHSSSALTPASSLKVLTAAAGLHYLGPAYRWRTETWAGGLGSGGVIRGNVHLRGLGDPTLTERDLGVIATYYRNQGVTRVTGDIVAVANWFDNVRYSSSWSTTYASSHYAAQVSALTLAPDTDYDAGTIIVRYSPGSTVGSRPRLSVTPPSAASYVRLVNKATTSRSGTATTFDADRTLGTNTITLSGQVPHGRSTGREWVTVHDPAMLAATVLRNQFAKAGIRVDGQVVRGSIPSGQKLWTRHHSMPLSDLLVRCLKLSNNSHAEVITKTLGRRKGRAGNWPDGLAHLRGYASHAGVPLTGAQLVDGSGLARANRLTARQLTAVLLATQREPWAATFRTALPLAGTPPVRWTGGTLATRMVDTAAEGRLRGKNGNLTGVTSLTGLVPGADGRPFAFAMVGNYSGTSPRRVEDRLGVLLAGWRTG